MADYHQNPDLEVDQHLFDALFTTVSTPDYAINLKSCCSPCCWSYDIPRCSLPVSHPLFGPDSGFYQHHQELFHIWIIVFTSIHPFIKVSFSSSTAHLFSKASDIFSSLAFYFSLSVFINPWSFSNISYLINHFIYFLMCTKLTYLTLIFIREVSILHKSTVFTTISRA